MINMDSVKDMRATTKEINLEIKRVEIKLGRLFDKFGFDNEFEEEKDLKEIKEGAFNAMIRLQKVMELCDLSIDKLDAEREAEELEEPEIMPDDDRVLRFMNDED
jgi:hypothetical protein